MLSLKLSLKCTYPTSKGFVPEGRVRKRQHIPSIPHGEVFWRPFKELLSRDVQFRSVRKAVPIMGDAVNHCPK